MMTNHKLTLDGRSPIKCILINLILLLTLCSKQVFALNKPPTLIRSIDLSTINENLPVNSHVFQLVAHDPEGTPVSFELHGTDLLRVDRRTGIVYVAKPIDRERTGDQIHFSVIISDQVPATNPINANGQPDEPNVVNIPVKLLVNDENDNFPKYEYIDPNITIPEDTTPGTPIISELIVNDLDTVGSTLRASCDGCNSIFHLQNLDTPSISQLKFSLILTQHIEFRLKQNQFNITLYVTDGVHNSSQRLFITIKDVQNRPPVFIGSKEISLPESTPVGSMIYHVRALDGDALNDEQMINLNEKTVNLQVVNFGRKLAYFLDENPGNFFSLNQNNGELRIVNQLDREAAFLNHESNQTTLIVKFKAIEISDDNGQLDDQEISTARSELIIRIIDVNDEKPQFHKDQYSVTIREDHQPGRILSPNLDILVKDRDLGLNSLFRVRLLEKGSEYFQLNPTVIEGSGQITIRLKENYTLDYENVENRKFNLLLEARELKTKEKFSTTSHLLIIVQDVNDNYPQFLEQSYLANLIETAKPGTMIKSLQAIDRDSPSLTRLSYELRGDHANLFDLDPKTGMLSVGSCVSPGVAPCLDFERKTHYNLTCTVYDGFGFNTSVPLRIQLLDANDNSPRFTHSTYEAEIEENADHFDTPVFVHAIDTDISSVLTYSLISESTESIGDHSTTVNNLDAMDEIEPIAEDRMGTDELKTSGITDDIMIGSASRMFYDFMESPITMPPNVEGIINEFNNNRKPINSLDSKQFSVDIKSGEIRVLRPVAYSDKPIVLTVKVTDGVHSAKCKVKISVRDTNDHDPTFDRPIYYTNVSEIAGFGQYVSKIVAHDDDVGLNSQIIYTLLPNLDDENGADNQITNDFIINNRTGIITVNSALDYDRKNIYAYKLKAEDCGEPRRHSITRVEIHVLNENNKKPYFKPTTQMTEVNEKTPISTRVYKLIAEDPDHLVQQNNKNHLSSYRPSSTTHNIGGYYLNHHLNDNSLKGNSNEDEMLIFRIENMVALNKEGTPVKQGSSQWHEINKFFAIDSSGYLVVINQLRYELAALVTLNVSVSDTLASTPQVSYGILVVKIIDFNDNPPRFIYPSSWTVLNPRVEFTMNEEQPIGSVVGKLTATDIDTEIDHYKIDPPSAYFSIDNQTGVIRLKKILDYETIREEDLKFSVIAYDTGVPQLNCEATVYVNLININDNVPVFNQTDYNVSIPENIEWNAFVLKVTAIDKDRGNYGKLKYSIVTPQLDENSDRSNAPALDILQYFFINEDTGVIKVTQGANLDREAGLTMLHFQVSAADNPSNSISMQPSDDVPSISDPVTSNRFSPKNQLSPHPFNDDLYSEESVSNEFHQPKSFAFANVHVKILDINDCAPIFQAQTHSFKIYDYSDINKEYNFYTNYFANPRDEMRNFVTQLHADDKDEGLNSLIKYRILSGNINNVFELDEITGKLYASKTPLKINRDIHSYKLDIEARDQNGKGELSDKIQISITIHRVNKYKPTFLFPLGLNNGNGFTAHNTLGSIHDNVVTVLENQPIGTRVAEVKAEDLDPGNNGLIKFAFKLNSNQTSQETDLFKIDPKTGIITTKAVFDREQKSQYSVMLSATDYKAEPTQFETLQELIIKIGDLDDNYPEFTRPQSVHDLISAKANIYSKDVLSKDESVDQNSLNNYNEDQQIGQSSLDYTYLFQVTENLPRGTVVGNLEAIDKDEKIENRRIFYFIVDGNEQGLFNLNPKTGLLQTTQPLDREAQSFHQLIIKATPTENYTVNQLPTISTYRNLTQKFKLERERSYSSDDLSLAIVGIQIEDLNDNEPAFEKELYRVAVSHLAKLNDTLVFVKAKDPDNQVNASLVYSIVHIDMFRKYIDEDPDNPARPIPSPFGIDASTGRLSVIQSITQYPIQTRFVVRVEARECSSPFRIVRSRVHVYVYDPAKLIKITIRLRPAFVEQRRDNIEQLLSENLENAHLKALITSIKFHLDVRRGRVVHEYTDCFVLVVDERNLSDISPEKMISKLDSNAAKLIFANDVTNYQEDGSLTQQQHYTIEQITLASSMSSGSLQPLLYNFTSQLSSDTQTMVFFILIILILIGFVSMAVSCCCLKSWYYQKLVERAQLAQQKNLFNVGATLANGIPTINGKYAPSFIAADQFTGDPNELYTQSVHSYPAYGVLNGSLNGINQDGSLRRPRSKNSTLRQQIPNGESNGRTLVKENVVWLEGANKYFEEQELSVQVATMDLTDDSVNYNYSVKQNKQNRQRLPANASSGQEVARKVNDYHELKNSSDTQSSDN